jgi:hypothetical protein
MKRKIISELFCHPQKKAKTTTPTIHGICRMDEVEKDSSEIRKDKRRSVPVSELPMLF